jgi:hypothetical protein
MVKNKKILEKFYRDLEKRNRLSLKEAFHIFDILHKEAVLLGAITSENILDGLEADLRIARAVNNLKL